MHFETPEDMQAVIDKYFQKCKSADPGSEESIVTITGLALELGMTRKSLYNYECREEFLPTVKRAKLRVENYVEKMLYLGKNAAGPIFNLKNNFDWKDERTTELVGANGGAVAVVTKEMSQEEANSTYKDMMDGLPES